MKRFTINAAANRRDPSRTTGLQKRYEKDIVKRLNLINKDIVQLVKVDDVFGLAEPNVLNLNAREAFRFQTDAEKVKSFQQWLQRAVDTHYFTVDEAGVYVESAYKTGMARAYQDSIKGSPAAIETLPFFDGTKQGFLQSAFNAPETVSKIQLIYTRNYAALKGITDAMDTQLSRVLSLGLANGYSPEKVSRQLTQVIGGKSFRTRARMIARTEIIYAHAEGQLDAFERLGIKKVDKMVEWQTAGDDRVCKQCEDREGTTYTIKEARGLIPLHPNCRCIWIPFFE